MVDPSVPGYMYAATLRRCDVMLTLSSVSSGVELTLYADGRLEMERFEERVAMTEARSVAASAKRFIKHMLGVSDHE